MEIKVGDYLKYCTVPMEGGISVKHTAEVIAVSEHEVVFGEKGYFLIRSREETEKLNQEPIRKRIFVLVYNDGANTHNSAMFFSDREDALEYAKSRRDYCFKKIAITPVDFEYKPGEGLDGND